jgi:GLPGLI family protein
MSVIDSGKIRISYAFNATDIKDYKTYDDLQLLEIGATVSKYYSFFISNSDSLVTDRIIKNPNSRAVPYSMGIRGKDSFWSEYYYSEYYKDFTANTVTEYARMPKALEKANAYYEEKIPALNWEIYADTFTVITYLCQKATCHFRGRDYVAWFTLDIPINNGPWKFGGLPGLILKISDTGKRCDFECIGIEQAEQKFPIKKYPEYETKYEKKDRKKILNFQKEIHEDYYKVAGLVPVWGGKPYQKRKYEPIELE